MLFGNVLYLLKSKPLEHPKPAALLTPYNPAAARWFLSSPSFFRRHCPCLPVSASARFFERPPKKRCNCRRFPHGDIGYWSASKHFGRRGHARLGSPCCWPVISQTVPKVRRGSQEDRQRSPQGRTQETSYARSNPPSQVSRDSSAFRSNRNLPPPTTSSRAGAVAIRLPVATLFTRNQAAFFGFPPIFPTAGFRTDMVSWWAKSYT